MPASSGRASIVWITGAAASAPASAANTPWPDNGSTATAASPTRRNRAPRAGRVSHGVALRATTGAAGRVPPDQSPAIASSASSASKNAVRSWRFGTPSPAATSSCTSAVPSPGAISQAQPRRNDATAERGRQSVSVRGWASAIVAGPATRTPGPRGASRPRASTRKPAAISDARPSSPWSAQRQPLAAGRVAVTRPNATVTPAAAASASNAASKACRTTRCSRLRDEVSPFHVACRATVAPMASSPCWQPSPRSASRTRSETPSQATRRRRLAMSVTSYPASARRLAATQPAGPPPTTAIPAPDRGIDRGMATALTGRSRWARMAR